MYRLLCCLTGMSCLLVLGCAPKLPYPVVPLSGTVTYQGTPVPGLSIYFAPETGRPSNGLTDKDGKFTMIYTPQVDGVQIGKGTFYTIVTPGAGDQYNNQELLDTIAKKYGLNNQLLQFEITKKEKNFELKLE